MKTKIIILIGITMLLAQCVSNTKQKDTENKAEKNWIWLFDGSSTDNWRDTKSDQFPEHGWVVEGDALTVLGKTEEEPGGHDIITKQQYSNFELELEVKLTEGANSGIKYFVTDSFPGNEGKFLGLEYQLIDNERHPDAQLGRDGNRKMGALYDLIPLIENYSINPPGEWNKVRIIVDSNQVEHWLNDKKIIEFDRHSPFFKDLVLASKYKDLEKFGELDQGRILLQGHGNDVSFRAIKIRTW
ncbi:MAG: DUF1080 domain-containing protein [Bacteroidales bacterium]|nr:DUF1080 domain-containing protein [Bacteroidales bacterium]MCF8390447.1 DUF1080 domain-containing protein [Bacteroidales bacterium]